MPALKYEQLIRNAFGYVLNNKQAGNRNSDPARLADADSFTDSNIIAVKAVIICAMQIFYNDLVENGKIKSDAEDNRICAFQSDIHNAETLKDISDLIDNYNKTVFDIYYNMKNGHISLK